MLSPARAASRASPSSGSSSPQREAKATSLSFGLSAQGLVSTDWTGISLVDDANANGQADANETTRYPGILSSDQTSITVSSEIPLPSEKSFVLISSFNYLPRGANVDLSLEAAGVLARDPPAPPSRRAEPPRPPSTSRTSPSAPIT